ncbi:MAG: WD40/YVTN/BNR-like repeat-containing protein [Polyangiaceae bacterium]
MRAAWPAAMLLAACSSPSSAGPPPSSWQVVHGGETATLLSVWGSSSHDVFAVGGPLGDGSPAEMLHFDGSAWKSMAPGGTETFWWVHGTGPADVWAVGEQGRVTHYDGRLLSEASPRPTTATLYGVWAAGPHDIWAVGGSIDHGASQPNDVCLHYDGSSWVATDGPPATGRVFFKVWGTSSSNLYVVGELGIIWHRKGTTWTVDSNGTLATDNLLTVDGCSATEVYAVGNAEILRSDGSTWTRVTTGGTSDGYNGVSCAGPGAPVVVGNAGTKQRLVEGRWQDDFDSDPHQDMHGAWADPSGGFWAAGGDFASPARDGGIRAGFVARYGP